MGQPDGGGQPAGGEAKVRPDRSFQAPLLLLRGPSGHPCGRGQQRTQSVQGPRQAPGPCHLSGCAPSRLPPTWLLPAPAPAAPASVSSEPLKQKHLPTPRTSRCLPPSHCFLPDSPPDSQGQQWGWEERLGWQGHSGGCREGAWDGGAGTARRSRLVAPGPGCSSCGQPDGGRCHRPPWSEPRGALCCLGQITEPAWASVSPPVT